MANDEPPYLNVGTDVSAKYKGAFCEAKIKKVIRVVKCKVTFRNNLGSFMVTDDLIKGPLRMGADVEAKHPEKNQFLEAVINKLQDYSQYTVVFDDGDETTLRRTSLCLKSGRHFAESPTLDQFPLTNPEHFGTPVIGAGKFKRKRRSTMNSSLDYESSDDDSFPRKLKAIRGKERDPDLGKVVAVDYGDRRKKDSWYPGLIVPHPAQSNIKITKEEHLIRSFKDGKYYQVPKRDTREFSKDSLPKIENNALKTAVDKAILYLEKEELPAHWDKALFMGLELPSADEDSQDSDLDTSDDEPSEDKDRFVAQLYKFMDERGTPINKAPTVSNKDLNLHKLFKIMHKLGGFNKVTNQNKWKTVYLKMGLPQSNANGPNQIKCAYKRYLQSFEDFYRKLGCTMVNNSRSTRGRHRSDRNFILTRTRDRESTASPKGRNSKDTKDKATFEKKTEEKPRTTDKKELKLDDNTKSEDKSKSPEKKKVEKPRPDEKEDKQKKEERPRLVRSQSLNKEKKLNSPKEEDKKDAKPEKARTREDARKEKNESPEKKGTRSSLKMELERKEKEEAMKEKKDISPNKKDKKEEKAKDIKDEKPKDKKDEKAVKDRKVVKEKKPEEKVIKDKNESPSKEKKDEKLLREKRDSSKEPKEDKSVKGRKEEAKVEDKSPAKKKFDRLAKEKKEEKIIRPRRENKSPLPESKKNNDENDSKSVKDEKVKSEIDKKEETAKEKPGPKLREKREDTPYSEEGDDVETHVLDDKDAASQDGLDKKGPGPKSKEDHEEAPNKGRKRSLKLHEKDEKDLEDALSDSDDDELDKDLKDLKNCEIELGDRVKVKYGRGRLKKVYDAKVLKIQTDGSEKRYFVHYNGWNNRYDEWVKRSFIVALANTNSKQTKDISQKASPLSAKRIDRGRPPGPIVQSKPARKNSTSSTNSSLSCSRATRSDKKNLQSSPLSSGLEPKKRTRKKSGAVGLTDTSQDSDSDAEENVDLDDDEVGDADVEDNTNTQNDSCFKEELFSDDEEKEKLEDVKRDDITELEKNITIEENTDDVKDTFFTPIKKETTKSETPVKDEISEPKETIKKVSTEPPNDPPKVFEKVDMKLEKDNKEVHTNTQSVALEKAIEKDSKTIQPEIVYKTLVEKVPKAQQLDGILKTDQQPEKMAVTLQPEKISKASLTDKGLTTELPEKVIKIETPEKVLKTDVLDTGSKIHLLEKGSKSPLPDKMSTFPLPEKVCKFPLPEKVSKLQIPEKLTKVQLLDKTSKVQLPEKISKILQPEKVATSQLSEKILKPQPFEKKIEAKKLPISETVAVTSINKNVIKPAEVIPSLTVPSEVKCEKSIFSPTPPKITSLLNIDNSKKDGNKTGFPQNSHLPSENRNLTFAGLHGLIHFDKNLSPNRHITKDTPFKTEMTKIVPSTPPKIDLKPAVELKSISSVFRPEKMPLFGSSSILSPPKLSEPLKCDEKSLLKASIFGFAMKLNEDKEQSKQLKPLDSPFKLALPFQKDMSKEKSEQKDEDGKTVKNLESSDKKTASSPFKSVLNQPEMCNVKPESTEQKLEKTKDNFDFLVESNNASTPKKAIEIKDNLFPLSFSTVTPKENFISNQPYNKTLALSAESLCCIKPKRTETFDLSKTIPSILERLKKDVVADVKGTESPPPQKDELNFNFLRGSQDTAKSLSRSESSNSLRICEDTSDTNDSNTDSKDLVINEKFDTPVVPSNATDNAVPCPNENLIPLPDVSKSEISVAESTLSSISSSSVMESKIDAKSSLKTSVITVASSKSPPILPVIAAEIKNTTIEESSSKKDNTSKEVEKEVEPPSIKEEDVSKMEPIEEKKIESKSEYILPLDNTEVKSVNLPDSNNEESSNSMKMEKSTHNNNYEKDSLFDDLLKIKNTNTNFSQSSVIMWNIETKGSTSSDEKMLVTSEEKKNSEESSSTPIMNVDVPHTVAPHIENSTSEKAEDELDSTDVMKEIKSEPEDNENAEDDTGISILSKKESKKKRLSKKIKENWRKFGSSEGFEKDDKDIKLKDGKSKSKKRRLDNEDFEKNKDLDIKPKSKKIKKNKNKKRLAKYDDMQGEHKKADGEDDHCKDISDKIKKKEKKKNDKKFLKSGMKGEFLDTKSELKKKKGKKNRDKFSSDRKDFLEKKTKKKKKPHIEENQDTDSEKETPHKSLEKKKKKDRKKFKTKDSSSSDDAGDKYFKEQKNLSNLPNSSNVLMRQDSKSDDPDMSFLLCEEKVPASPVGISNMADDTSGSSSIEGNRINSAMDILPLPNVYPCIDNIGSSDTLNKHSIDTSTVLDNTPPTTPSSTESLLSSSPSHERDSFSMNYPESTQSGRDSGEGESDIFRCNPSRTIVRGSDEYHAATTLAFAVCKSVSDKSKEEPSQNFLKRQKSEGDEHSPAKRKKKSKRVRRCSESAKSPRHKPSYSRLSKIESCCEDSSGASPAASSSPPYSNTSINFSRSPHRLSCSSEGYSRYNNFYVHLHEKDPEKRIALLQEKMAALRKEYMDLRAKFIAIDHKRRRARKKIREAAAANVNPSAQSEDGQSCS